MNKEFASRIVAVVILSVPLTYAMRSWEQVKVAQIDAMGSAAYVEQVKRLYSHPFASKLIGAIVIGVVFVVCIEVTSMLVRAAWPRREQESLRKGEA
jgi:hypothetical protein